MVAWPTTGNVATFRLAGFPHLTSASADPWDREHRKIVLSIAAAVAVSVCLVALRAAPARAAYPEG